MVVIISGFILISISLLILIGAVRLKFRDMYNPIQKDNSDYRFIEVENVKTRSIFRS